ncbi:glycerophosphodiester phosphodiesterase family protein [Desulfoglaeba alkanexedens]|uniref:glycerophosphodiester phosphodiesterase n=1 Tax=Desulfoglaeba alkanexedens ALDC TaxID=980445 RepID=A0A4P8L473_9BACT|nr:glycerophosphodiester phosphodiesterase family protein [Desulfoglaeba alkanexedens]QCQ22776.1 glycerophosphodiester phosphodiesterase [Desulfoglaeba alkanexedens ALDC]
MKNITIIALALAVAGTCFVTMSHADQDSYSYEGVDDNYSSNDMRDGRVDLGPRPFYLVEGMDEGKLKDRLMQCKDGPFYRTDFSIGHRGAALQFPEHSDVSYMAAARMGAGIVECDVTFTKDGELVCRHSECDLHTTTNIVATPLNDKCTVPWTGPVDADHPAPMCCTSDLTLEEFKGLKAKMDASDPKATTPEGYLGGTAGWRTDLYTGRAHVMTFKESIAMNQALGVKHTPELKNATHQDRINAIFGGQEQYAQKFADTMEDAGVAPRDTWPQSFNLEDVFYWIDNTNYGKQAVYLLDYDTNKDDIIIQAPYDTMDRMEFFMMLKKRGVNIIAPPMPALLTLSSKGDIVPSKLAKHLKRMGFDIITWTLERSDLRHGASKAGYYYDFDPTGKAIRKDSDMYKALDVLAKEVKILGIFSDWPATVTYYDNCMGLNINRR